MFEFWYDVSKVNDLKSQLIYMDMASFIVEVNLENTHKQLAKYMDLSNLGEFYPYAPNQKIINKDRNKGVLGMFIDESAGKTISEIIALRSKMYSVMQTNGSVIKKVKGIGKTTVKKYINFDDYKTIIETNGTIRHEMKTLRSKDHNIQLLSINKLSLSPFDDKRYILDDGITTLPFGYKK